MRAEANGKCNCISRFSLEFPLGRLAFLVRPGQQVAAASVTGLEVDMI